VLKPWTNGNPMAVLGSGTIIEGKRILTNAHLVLYATEVQIQPRHGGDKIEAKVEMVAPDIDLALLSIKEAKFFDAYPALARAGKLPKVQDNVAVHGYPVGGNDQAVTKGVVSRIEFGGYYNHGHCLLVQVSAAINPGNSGGPAVVDKKMIGIVLSRMEEQQNIGYVIPNEEIDFFLEHIKDGRYDGKPMDTVDVRFQSSENKALRKFLNLDDSAKGLLAIPPHQRPANYPFQEFDLLTKVGPYDIDNEGMVRLADNLRVGFPIVFAKLVKDNVVPMTLVRNGKLIRTSLPVSKVDNRLIRAYQGERPAYFIHGPLVLSPAKADAIGWYARIRPELQTMQSPLLGRLTDREEFPGEELVVVTSTLFDHEISKGYGEALGQVVTEVNGTKVRNLKHLVEILRDCTDEYLTFRFAERGSEVLVFGRDAMIKATEDILAVNGIRANRRGSEDMIKVWEQSKGAK
jgi:S1-C subfamily serine protease